MQHLRSPVGTLFGVPAGPRSTGPRWPSWGLPVDMGYHAHPHRRRPQVGARGRTLALVAEHPTDSTRPAGRSRHRGHRDAQLLQGNVAAELWRYRGVSAISWQGGSPRETAHLRRRRRGDSAAGAGAQEATSAVISRSSLRPNHRCLRGHLPLRVQHANPSATRAGGHHDPSDRSCRMRDTSTRAIGHHRSRRVLGYEWSPPRRSRRWVSTLWSRIQEKFRGVPIYLCWTWMFFDPSALSSPCLAGSSPLMGVITRGRPGDPPRDARPRVRRVRQSTPQASPRSPRDHGNLAAQVAMGVPVPAARAPALLARLRLMSPRACANGPNLGRLCALTPICTARRSQALRCF